MINVYLWNFLVFSGYVLGICYLIASYFILKSIYKTSKDEKSMSWTGLVTGIAIIGVANLFEAFYQSYVAFSSPEIFNVYAQLDPASNVLVLLALVFKYFGVMLLFLGAYSFAKIIKTEKLRNEMKKLRNKIK